jgi:hypothetical protein
MSTFEKIEALIDKQSNELKIKVKRLLEVHDKSIARQYTAASKTTASKKSAPLHSTDRPAARKAAPRKGTYQAADNYSSDSN